MKCLFISAPRYSLNNSIIYGVKDNDIEIKNLTFSDFFSKPINKFVEKYEALPNRIKKLWMGKYVSVINNEYVRYFDDYSPDIVIIYNNQNFKPETIKYFKKKSKVIFVLGDNPLYTPTNQYNLHILFNADYIISSDTFWIEQLKILGIKNIYFDCFGFCPQVYFKSEINEVLQNKYQSDLVYVGSATKTNWGYKRFLFLNQFSKLDIKAYMNGDGYSERWNNFFPELNGKIIPHQNYDTVFNNMVYNCSKIAPVDLVPSLFNGVHLRVFEILGAGIFPLCEYSRDLSMIFNGINVPFINNYNDAKEIAVELLKNEQVRDDLVKKMRKKVIEDFDPPKVIKRVLNKI